MQHGMIFTHPVSLFISSCIICIADLHRIHVFCGDTTYLRSLYTPRYLPYPYNPCVSLWSQVQPVWSHSTRPHLVLYRTSCNLYRTSCNLYDVSTNPCFSPQARPPRTSPHRKPHHLSSTRSDLTTDPRFSHFPMGATKCTGLEKAGSRPPRRRGASASQRRSAHKQTEGKQINNVRSQFAGLPRVFLLRLLLCLRQSTLPASPYLSVRVYPLTQRV